MGPVFKAEEPSSGFMATTCSAVPSFVGMAVQTKQGDDTNLFPPNYQE